MVWNAVEMTAGKCFKNDGSQEFSTTNKQT